MKVKKVTFLINIKKNYIKRERWDEKKEFITLKREGKNKAERVTDLSFFLQPLCVVSVCVHIYQKTCEEATDTFETMG